MKSAIIFTRCSSSGSLESRQDTTRQVEDLLHYAATNDITVAKTFQEHISGANQTKTDLSFRMPWPMPLITILTLYS